MKQLTHGSLFSGIGGTEDGKSRKSELNHLIAQEIGQNSQLNPLFVTEMMGFPIDWLVLPFLSGEPKL